MRLLLLMLLLSSELAADTQIDVEKHCSENSKSLIMTAWEAYPRHRRTRIGDPEKSLRLFEKALQESPECQWALRHLSKLNIEMNHIDEAKKYNNILIEKYPTDPVAIDDKSALLALEGKFDEGVNLLKKVIYEHGEGNGSWYYSIALIYAQNQQNQKALVYLELSASISADWLDEQNAQADREFSEVVKEKRFQELLRKYLNAPNQSLKNDAQKTRSF